MNHHAGHSGSRPNENSTIQIFRGSIKTLEAIPETHFFS